MKLNKQIKSLLQKLSKGYYLCKFILKISKIIFQARRKSKKEILAQKMSKILKA